MTVVQKYTGEIKNPGEAITISKEMMKADNTIKMKKKKSQITRLETTGTDRIIRGATEEEVTDRIITSKGETSKMRTLLNLINKMINIKVGTRKTINMVDTTTIIIKTIKNMIKDMPTMMALS